MHRVIVGMDDRVMDVGDSFSQLHTHVQRWLTHHVGAESKSWFSGYDPEMAYYVGFVKESDAVQFKLTWL